MVAITNREAIRNAVRGTGVTPAEAITNAQSSLELRIRIATQSLDGTDGNERVTDPKDRAMLWKTRKKAYQKLIDINSDTVLGSE